MKRIYKTVFGIQTGDIVRTSYNSGPYEVWDIHGPYYITPFVSTLVIRTWPVCSLKLVLPDDEKPRAYSFYGINDVRQEPDGRWFTDQNDEIFVVEQRKRDLPVDMFLSYPQRAIPYPFVEGVDYTRQAWRCGACGDFNGPPRARYQKADCPRCGRYAEYKLVLMEPRNRDICQQSASMLAL